MSSAISDIPSSLTDAPQRNAAAPLEYARPTVSKPPRLLSLDVFRGLVILAMLVVNNLGDGATTGYFWKHADWPAMSWGQAWQAWWGYATGQPEWENRAQSLGEGWTKLFEQVRNGPQVTPDEWRRAGEISFRSNELNRRLAAAGEEEQLSCAPWSHIPLFTYCTLADYVMPGFMLIIGIAIPFSVAAARARGMPNGTMWLRTVKRAATLVILGWILCYFRDQFANSIYGKSPWTFHLGMDVLQLLGVGYLVARVIYELPAKPRAVVAAGLLLAHWAILRFYPQGVAPAGTFTEDYEAIGYIYRTWPLWDWITLHLGPVTIGWIGLMSVPPAAATMLIGTLIGDWLRREEVSPVRKVRRLAMWGLLLAAIGIAWAFDLPFNKPRWTPCYLVYVSGVGAMLIAGLYALIDIRGLRGWTYPLVVFGTNAIAVYFLSILAKVLLLNTPRVSAASALNVLLMTYGVLVVCTLVIAALAGLLIAWAWRRAGVWSMGLLLLILPPVVLIWTRFVLLGADSAPVKGTQPLIEHVLSILKFHLGPWAGGWLFTISIVGFWWLVMDQMYRRRIFWKV